jgi:site-specific recombinase XerD
MLEQLFNDPAAVERLRAGLLGPHLDVFVRTATNLGYTRTSLLDWLVVLRDLQRWLGCHTLGVADLEESVLERFLDERKRRQRREGKVRCSIVGARTVYFLLQHLRQQGVVAEAKRQVDRSPLAMLYSRYEGYLRQARGLSPTTPRGYWCVLRRFLLERFGDGPIRFRELTPDDISDFLLRHARSGTPGQAKFMVTALRSFFRFLFQEGETDTDLAGAVPTVRSWRLSGVPKYIAPEEVQKTIDGCSQAHPVGRRNRALLLLIARLGLRAGEVISLELGDIDWRAGLLTVRGKGGCHDRLPLPTDVGEALATYLRRDRPHCDSRKVFVRIRAPHQAFAHPSTISTIVRRALESVGLEPPLKGAHLLRHSLATGMLRRGASMAEIGQILRHRSPSTTEIYAKVDINGLRSIARPWPIQGGAR